MPIHPLGQPCRNFQILGTGTFTDPRDQRQKVVLSNFAAGATGNLVLLDPETGDGEDIALPGDSGAWAVLNWRDEKLLIGTCGTYGYLHSLDLASREWAEPRRDPDEQYIWNLAAGSDGLVYGGTYPGCVLLQYDPDSHTLTNVGRMSEAAANLYSRMVYGGIDGHILVSCGTADPHLALWNMASGETRRFGPAGASVREVGDGFICIQTGDQTSFYDSSTLEPLDADPGDRLSSGGPPSRYQGSGQQVELGDGSWLVTRGQEYYVDGGGTALPELRPIPAERPATHILSLIADHRGRLWGSAGFGQTIFRYDPDTDESWNSQVVTDKGGEVYGMAWTGDRLFMATYSGGDHVVYDPAATWSQLDNANPQTLESVSPQLIRPSGKSVVGPDGHVWTGWMAAYGVYGGGLSRVDVETLEVTCWHDPVPKQAVTGTAADDEYLYLITGGSANGLTTREVEPQLLAWAAEGERAARHTFPHGVTLRSVVTASGLVVVANDERLGVFSPEGLTLKREVEPPETCLYLAALPDGRAAAFTADHLWLLDPVSGDLADGGPMPERVGALASTPAGRLYIAAGTELYQLGL